jgi:hypothetical protein
VTGHPAGHHHVAEGCRSHVEGDRSVAIRVDRSELLPARLHGPALGDIEGRGRGWQWGVDRSQRELHLRALTRRQLGRDVEHDLLERLRAVDMAGVRIELDEISVLVRRPRRARALAVVQPIAPLEGRAA